MNVGLCMLGLVVVHAFYGDKKVLDQVWHKLKQPSTAGAHPILDESMWEKLRQHEKVVDVVVPLQSLVRDSKLLLAGGFSKASINVCISSTRLTDF
jgi:hypothetical protein